MPVPNSKRPAHSLRDHIRSRHEFEAKPCEHGCEPTKIYTDDSKYRYHILSIHSGRWPFACIYPGCEYDEKFVNCSTLERHMRVVHVLIGEAAAPYFPPHPAEPVWSKPQRCFIEGCSSLHQNRGAQTDHLRGVHRFTLRDAQDMIDQRSRFDMVAPPVRVGSKAKAPSTKYAKGCLGLETGPPPKERKRTSSETTRTD